MFWKPTRQAGLPARTSQKAAMIETAPCEKQLTLHVSPEEIAPVRTTVIGEFQKRAVLPGFRKGKAPAGLVEQRFAKDIQEETMSRVTRQAIEQATKEHALKPVGPVEVKTANFTDEDGLTLEATVEVEPVFALAAYHGIALTRRSDAVAAHEMDQALEQLRNSMAQLVPAGEGQPKERHVPALDDELAKDLGYETLGRLREHVEAKLREHKRAETEQALEEALCDELLGRHTVQVPARLVDRQVERLRRDFTVRLLLSGVPEDDVPPKLEQFGAQLRTNAQRLVKLGFILDRIAAQESITVDEPELVSRLWELSRRWRKDPAQVRKLLDARGLWPSVSSTIRQEKTLAFVKAAATISGAAEAGASATTQKGGAA